MRIVDAASVTLQAVLLSEPTEQLNSFNLLLYMAPIATCALIPTTLLLEPASLHLAQELVMNTPGFRQLLLCNCLLAFFANLLNFLVTKHTSALTLQVRPFNLPCSACVYLPQCMTFSAETCKKPACMSIIGKTHRCPEHFYVPSTLHGLTSVLVIVLSTS
jgi:hypothetical protein